MYPVRVLSFNDGWNYLTQQKSAEWADISESIRRIDPQKIRTDYNVFLNLSMAWRNDIRKYGWRSVQGKSKNAKAGGVNIPSVKNRVAVRMLVANSITNTGLAKFIYVDGPQAKAFGLIDLFVLLVPADDILSISPFNETSSRPYTEANCLAQLDELLLPTTDLPFVILFFSNIESNIDIEDISEKINHNSIERAIEFPPQYYQAGVTALSNFGEVLRDKYPGINAKVRIEQEGNRVRMHIELPNGETDTVEEVLEKYFLVVSKKAPAESIFDNKLHAAKLEAKIDLLDAEVRSTERLLRIESEKNNYIINNYEKMIGEFRGIMSRQAEQINAKDKQIEIQGKQIVSLIDLSGAQVASHNQLQLAQIGHSTNLFKDLLREAQGNQITLNAVRSLEYNLLSGIATVEAQEQARTSLVTIQQTQPALLAKIASIVESASCGVLGNVVYEFIKSVNN
ncbi:hypothetical protein [Hymenobacter cheonanensis]|uniref:hypothetical protein n=1 Tax=Hymenobacter sp. CA2-7 TaxID=3063993 RepID=UPI002712D6FE|nr:hypothetical protein [Hymenobacter sp. CA2-7]MDO7888176.1 hypothetical protein [Hymenobacter sp. CA2-7]